MLSLNESQYLALCAACDSVLAAKDATVERLAIPWLHVIREHPVFLDNYKDVFDLTPRFLQFRRRCSRRLRNWLCPFQIVIRALKRRRQLWYGPKVFPERVDVLFISHLINSSHAGRSTDFYFGDLPNDLVESGYSSAIVLVNHTEKSEWSLSEAWNRGSGSSIPRIVLSSSIGVSKELAICQRLKVESRNLRRAGRLGAGDLSRRVLLRASEEALSSGARMALRTAEQIAALVSRLNPRLVILTHEGHAWERAVLAATKVACPSAIRVGYQHAAVFRLQHAIRRNLGPKYDPDVVLSAGNAGKAQLEKAFDGIRIGVLGSNRTARPTKTSSVEIGDRNSVRKACLVLPEGIPGECHLLFDFSLACASNYPEIDFIWRLHPIIDFNKLAKKNRKLAALPNNITLSSGDMLADISRCRWALYRGTTAIIQVVGEGLRPLYLEQEGEMNMDPLYELNGWRKSICTVYDFAVVIGDSDETCSITDRSSTIDYCKNYFAPFSISELVALLTIANADRSDSVRPRSPRGSNSDN